MISVKDLYSVHITNVKQYQVGDNIEFTFLTRKKDSFTLSHTNKQETGNSSCGKGDVCDPFSKFRLTIDVDFSVRHAISDLDGWLARADSGLVNDLEKLPYLCEDDLSEMLPPEALAPFLDEIKNRASQRKQLAKKELKEKLKAEVTSNYALSMSTHSQFISRDDPPTFSQDDLKAQV
ncbi:hypothetical protein KIW84_045115 [Lathyrus oleraceus]|uniref:Uncharacterized protein n=1 Tax=Pisum sativum TaxID=3888 RepID=A0A9D4XJY3_PEA|nr:hypothetical protein KIW84_045115 [Pisum sativum]